MHVAESVTRLGEETAFEVLAKARALEAQGIDMVHMEIGEPDFDTPDFIKDAAIRAINEGFTHYTPSKGLPEVREVFADYIIESRKVPVNRSNIVITPGTKTMLFLGLLATVNPGDEVIYPDPGFMIYKSVIDFIGAKGVPLPMREERDFRFNHEDLWRIASENTKMIIINSPQNPTGSVLTEHDLVVISEVAKEFDCWVLSDEAYSAFHYNGDRHNSIIKIPGMLERTIILEGFSKNYAMPGWRIGYGVMPEGLASHVTRLVNNNVSCTAAFTQHAARAAYEGPQDAVMEMISKYEERRDLIVEGLNSIDNVTCLKPPGGFYVFPNFKEFGWTSRDIETYLLQKANVATLSGSAFGKHGEGYIRMCYSCANDTIEQAIERISKALGEFPKIPSYRQPIYAD